MYPSCCPAYRYEPCMLLTGHIVMIWHTGFAWFPKVFSQKFCLLLWLERFLTCSTRSRVPPSLFLSRSRVPPSVWTARTSDITCLIRKETDTALTLCLWPGIPLTRPRANHSFRPLGGALAKRAQARERSRGPTASKTID